MSGSIFFGINIALKGLMAQQTALSVAAHNIANADTKGYSRQRVDMKSSIPIPGLTPGGGMLGSGVEIAEIRRAREDFLDYQVRGESSTLGSWEAIRDNLEKIELIFMEPKDTGFNELLGEFWNGWQEVAKYAESSPLRTTLKETAVALTESMNNMRRQLVDIQNDIQEQIKIDITELNAITQRIADLNAQIVKVKITGQNPNDLLDQRDLALDQLAKLTDFTKKPYQDETNGEFTGAITVEIDGKLIVDHDGSHAIVMDDSDEITFKIDNGDDETNGEESGSTGDGDNGDNGTTINFTDGRIAGFLKVGWEKDITGSVQHYIAKLDTLAVSLAKAVNDIHAQGLPLQGEKPLDFFVFLDVNGEEISLTGDNGEDKWEDSFAAGLISAANIHVNPAIQDDVSQIAAAKPLDENDGELLAGNGEIALEIARLKDAYLNYGENGLLKTTAEGTGGTTFGNFYKDMIAELGVVTDQSQRMVTNQQVLLGQIETRRESMIGVNLDEEMANMVNLQHAFQANARVIKVMDEMLDTIINGLMR